MGQKISDGKTFNAVAPDATVILDYDLYRISGRNGVAITAKDAVQTDRTLAFEMDTNAIYSILVPVALDPAVGDLLYWTDQSVFQRGDTDLIAAGGAAVGDEACFWVTGAKNAAGYVQGRVLNGGARFAAS